MKSLLAAAVKGEADANEPEGFNSLQTLVNADFEDAGSFLAPCEGVSGTLSSVDSVDYAIRSVTSFKERTNWFYRPHSLTGRGHRPDITAGTQPDHAY